MKVEVAEALFLTSILMLAAVYAGFTAGGLVGGGVQPGSGGVRGAVWMLLALLGGFGIAVILLFRHPRLYIVMVWLALGYSLALSMTAALGAILGIAGSLTIAALLLLLALLWRGEVRSAVLGLAAGGVGGVAGVFLGPFLGALFLLLLTAFDVISVFVTGHMVQLGERAIEEGAPVLLEIDAGAGPRYLGLGDVFSVSLPAGAMVSVSGSAGMAVSLALVVPSALVTYLTARALRRPLPATVFLALPQAMLLLGWVTGGT